MIECPLHGPAREDFIMTLSAEAFEAVARAISSRKKLIALLGSSHCEDWEALGCFAARVRQALHKSRRHVETLHANILSRSFDTKRVAWRKAGKHVRRHGIFWSRPALAGCACLSAEMDSNEWQDAMWMPSLDHNLRCLTVAPFDPQWFRRLGFLQAEARRLDW